MRGLRTGLLLALGVVAGAVATAWARPAAATASQFSAPDRFTTTFQNSAVVGGIYLIKDTRTGGCWIAIQNSTGKSLAQAGPGTCD